VLGDESAAAILQELAGGGVAAGNRRGCGLDVCSFETALQVLEEFQQILVAQDFLAVGGHDVATRLLIKAFGENGAKAMLQRLMRTDEVNSMRMDSLKRADPQQLARFLVGEHSQTKALILGHLDPKQASALLMKLEPGVRADCVKRLANMGQFSPDVATKVSTVLNRRLRSVGDQSKRTDFGFRDVAELMNRLDPMIAREILEKIEKDEPQLVTNIKDLMFTFDDFLEVPDHELREMMNAIDKKVLMTALKGASEDLRSHFYRTMSTRAVEMMKEDAEAWGRCGARM
jgi:flagellar motor switch protein FliG